MSNALAPNLSAEDQGKIDMALMELHAWLDKPLSGDDDEVSAEEEEMMLAAVAAATGRTVEDLKAAAERVAAEQSEA